jgi:hypothetical protein
MVNHNPSKTDECPPNISKKHVHRVTDSVQLFGNDLWTDYDYVVTKDHSIPEKPTHVAAIFCNHLAKLLQKIIAEHGIPDFISFMRARNPDL